MAVEVFMPKMSDHMESGAIVGWLVKEGDQVTEGQALVEIETDKVTAEIEAPAAGILKGVRTGVEKGAEVPVGETIAFIVQDDEKIPELPPLGGMPPESKPPAGKARAGERGPGAEMVDATPVARKLAKQFGIDLNAVSVSGSGGRVRKEDVLKFRQTSGAQHRVKASPAARRRARELGMDLSIVRGTGPGGLVREADVETFSEEKTAVHLEAAADEEQWIDLSPIERRTGERMLMSTSTAPQFSLDVQADAEKLLWIKDMMNEQAEEVSGERLSVTALLVKIVAGALKQYPRANSSFQNGRLKLFAEVNVGVAVGSPQGLIVPVVHNADRRSLSSINGEIRQFADKARDMRFSSAELSGGTFTVSNLGMYGIERFQAIVNPPQCCILSVGSIVKIPVGTPDETIVLRPMMHLTLTVDHRCMDGLQGAQFLNTVKQMIESPAIFFIDGG